MKGLFVFSYALLWGLVVLEAAVLHEVLRRTVWFKQLYARSGRRLKREQLPIGTLAPDFDAPVLGTGRALSTSGLKGRSTILLFVSPVESSSSLYEKLSVGIHVLWHKVEGNLYLICSGGEEECRQIARDHRIEGFGHGEVPLILDEGARIAQSFLINSTPQAVMLDRNARVSRYGRPLPAEEVADGES